jgi:hypothetical protein
MNALPRRTRTQPTTPLYPEGHAPFQPRGCLLDRQFPTSMAEIAQDSRIDCIGQATFNAAFARHGLEKLRLQLYRAEALATHEPALRADGSPPDGRSLPMEVRGLPETLEATKRCLEDWLESETCASLTAVCKAPNPTKRG